MSPFCCLGFSFTDALQDSFAILLAAYHPRIKLLGISTVFGNASLELVNPTRLYIEHTTNMFRNTTHNCGSLLTAFSKTDIPYHIGLNKALERPALHAPTDIHGITGLDGTDLLPKPECAPSHIPAVQAMAEALKAQPVGTAWIVATGAFTNVGALFREYPELAEHIKGVSVMGGAVGGGFSDAQMGVVDGKPRIGNYTPFAEFNILVDPEAAAELFGNPVIAKKMVIMPLDLTHQVLATKDVRNLLLYGKEGQTTGPGKTTLRTMLVELLYFFAKTYE